MIVQGRCPHTNRGLRLTLAKGCIAAIDEVDLPPDAPFIARGLVDLQVNGYGGIDFNASPITPTEALTLCQTLASKGVTQLLPTIITASKDDMEARIAAICAARKAHPLVEAMFAGLHIEGPHISALDGPRGAHPLAHVRAPDTAEYDNWQQLSEGLIKIVTLAPEHAGSESYIRHLVAAGTRLSIGHSAASPEEIARAAEAGATLSTHLGNGLAATLPRHPNLLWAQLADDRLCAGFIADGHHLSAETFRAMLRAKGIERAFIVSDTVALAGGTPGRYQQAVGEDVELTAEGKIMLYGTPFLAGAALPLLEMLPRVQAMAKLSFEEALTLASTSPAGLIGLKGLEVGAAANIINYIKNEEKNIVIKHVFINGECINVG